jgi:hypothetical protein
MSSLAAQEEVALIAYVVYLSYSSYKVLGHSLEI